MIHIVESDGDDLAGPRNGHPYSRITFHQWQFAKGNLCDLLQCRVGESFRAYVVDMGRKVMNPSLCVEQARFLLSLWSEAKQLQLNGIESAAECEKRIGCNCCRKLVFEHNELRY